MHEVVRLLQHELVNQGVALHVEVAADLPPVVGDRVQLQQVLLNLVLNGIEALAGVAQGPREVWIRVQPEAAGTVLVAVEDTGVGITPGAARPHLHGVLHHEGAGAGDGAGNQSLDRGAARGAAVGGAARRAGRHRAVYPADGARGELRQRAGLAAGRCTAGGGSHAHCRRKLSTLTGLRIVYL